MAPHPDTLTNLHERIPRRLEELSLTTPSESVLATVRAVLAAAGMPADRLSWEQKADRFTARIFFEDRAEVMRLHALFVRLKIAGLAVKTSVLTPKDWLTRWKREWKPARLTKKLDVVPVWYQHRYKPSPGRSYILMDTLLSFGTGLHETTRMVAQMIEDRRGSLGAVLDIGTGTGVLAMVAVLHGAAGVTAIDIGDLSVQAAKGNLKVNGLRAAVKKADIYTFRPGRQFDFVAANLITHDLIACGRRIVRLVKPGGFLAVSGISLENLPRLQGAFDGLPLRCLEVRKGKQWAGLLYQR